MKVFPFGHYTTGAHVIARPLRIQCPICGGSVTEVRSKGSTLIRCNECSNSAWGGRPLPDRETMEARTIAGDVVARLHTGAARIAKRETVYAALSVIMHRTKKSLNLHDLSAEQARELCIYAERLREINHDREAWLVLMAEINARPARGKPKHKEARPKSADYTPQRLPPQTTLYDRIRVIRKH